MSFPHVLSSSLRISVSLEKLIKPLSEGKLEYREINGCTFCLANEQQGGTGSPVRNAIRGSGAASVSWGSMKFVTSLRGMRFVLAYSISRAFFFQAHSSSSSLRRFSKRGEFTRVLISINNGCELSHDKMIIQMCGSITRDCPAPEKKNRSNISTDRV